MLGDLANAVGGYLHDVFVVRLDSRRREATVRAALGADRADMAVHYLSESLLLCGSGAVLGVAIAQPMVSILSRYAARYSVRALDLSGQCRVRHARHHHCSFGDQLPEHCRYALGFFHAQ